MSEMATPPVSVSRNARERICVPHEPDRERIARSLLVHTYLIDVHVGHRRIISRREWSKRDLRMRLHHRN
jgi:hypothetical protein